MEMSDVIFEARRFLGSEDAVMLAVVVVVCVVVIRYLGT
jgi:hypothetical protein